MSWSRYFFIFCIISITSCSGVNYSLSGINIPPDVKTVSVQLFQNQSTLINPLLAQVYTEKLKDKFINQTSLKVIQQDGDWQFSGAITAYDVSPVDRQAISGGTRNKLTISIKVTFKDIKTKVEEEKSKEFTFSRFQDFDAAASFNSIESELIDKITDALVLDVFNETALTW